MSERWRLRAACLGADPDLFMPDEVGRRGALAVKVVAARTYCAGCPVLAECGSAGDARNEVGIWGGVYRTGSTGAMRWYRLVPGSPAPAAGRAAERAPA